MKIAVAFQKKILILMCAVLSFMNYNPSVYQKRLWIDGNVKDKHNSLMLETV